MSDVILELKSISKSFGPVKVLKGIDFVLRRGTLHAICGENGAGKSTLMKVLSGVHAGDPGGSMFLEGRPYNPKNPMDALRSGISMIYQELNLAEFMTVTENVFLGAEPTSRKVPFLLDRARMEEEVRELIDRYGFDLDPRAEISTLSVGQAQIVELLKSIHRKARIIVMDEPTGALSEKEAEKLFEIIGQLKAEGISIIYISHRMEEIKRLADDITVIRDGVVAASGPAASLEIGEIIHHMVGREISDFYPVREKRRGREVFRAEDLSDGSKVRNVSFSVHAGEIVGMAGLVGAGRTEIANAIFGASQRTAGSLFLNGKPIAPGNPREAIDLGIGYLTEDRKRTGLCVTLPGTWNITLPNLPKLDMGSVISPGRESRAAEEYARQVKVKWEGGSSPADTLSGGNQQKLLLARWLMSRSEFLVFDEPTRGVDVGAKAEIYQLLDQLSREDKALLIISSDLPEIFGICDRILVVKDGRITAELETARTTPDEVMKYAATLALQDGANQAM